ncbi:Predicted metalloprotease [Geodermatophilus pulveris]|uniref:Predicted metalloprotease n=1 Tax=Geodermatophilus pulveris TaxID=1564159 RepID=A0A239BCM7_9ACTN|nr:neutral zinc metallopeptidase [Geodermatophilus pulveris]SNS04924.1 Predicted metalloprotease [Geodermatophilus pulveris]
MPASSPRRAAVAPVATAALLVLSGCSSVVIGLPSAAQPPASDLPAAELTVVGATDGPVDTLARNALADLETFWAQQSPEVFGRDFEPLAGGYFSVDPGDVDPVDHPQGIGCGSDPREVEGNAFYCQAPDAPNSDSISYDRAFLGELAEQHGRFIPALVMAHEFGHAVQGRVGYPDYSISVETQADCFAGAWTAWVADGQGRHSQIRAPELDEVLAGYLLLRDPVGTSITTEAAHGSYFDRISAFQEGFDAGNTACRDNFTAQRPYTQSAFRSANDAASGGNAPFQAAQGFAADGLAEFWTLTFDQVFGETFTAPGVQPFAGTAPDCATDDLDLVFCPDEGLVGYDVEDLAGPAYEQLGNADYAVITAVSLPYALAAREQLGLSSDGGEAVRSAVCLTGWFSAVFFDNELRTAEISPGDIDEAAQFLLAYGTDPSVVPDVQLSGFQLVDLFRNGFFEGAAACDVGV